MENYTSWKPIFLKWWFCFRKNFNYRFKIFSADINRVVIEVDFESQKLALKSLKSDLNKEKSILFYDKI